jgi:hypothetical protein
MPWTYRQKTGEMCDPSGAVIETGYAGAGPYVNRPAAEARPNEGPLPTGTYIIEPAYDHANLGPCAIPLTPHVANQMHGRYGFFVHGDTASQDQTASEGCIILSRSTRDLIDASEDRALEVVV